MSCFRAVVSFPVSSWGEGGAKEHIPYVADHTPFRICSVGGTFGWRLREGGISPFTFLAGGSSVCEWSGTWGEGGEQRC